MDNDLKAEIAALQVGLRAVVLALGNIDKRYVGDIADLLLKIANKGRTDDDRELSALERIHVGRLCEVLCPEGLGTAQGA